jgi:hypothetical protein
VFQIHEPASPTNGPENEQPCHLTQFDERDHVEAVVGFVVGFRILSGSVMPNFRSVTGKALISALVFLAPYRQFVEILALSVGTS